jgi:hypothetical protein
MWSAATHNLGSTGRRAGHDIGPLIRLGPLVSKLGRQATVSRSAGSGSEMEMRDWGRRIIRQCEIGERNKDQSGFFEPMKNNQVRKRT